MDDDFKRVAGIRLVKISLYTKATVFKKKFFAVILLGFFFKTPFDFYLIFTPYCIIFSPPSWDFSVIIFLLNVYSKSSTPYLCLQSLHSEFLLLVKLTLSFLLDVFLWAGWYSYFWLSLIPLVVSAQKSWTIRIVNCWWCELIIFESFLIEFFGFIAIWSPNCVDSFFGWNKITSYNNRAGLRNSREACCS